MNCKNCNHEIIEGGNEYWHFYPSIYEDLAAQGFYGYKECKFCKCTKPDNKK